MSTPIVITVTGATGTIGSELIRLLSRDGVATSALARDVSRAPAAPHVAWVRADLGQAEALVTALAGTTQLFLLSANAEGDRARPFRETRRPRRGRGTERRGG